MARSVENYIDVKADGLSNISESLTFLSRVTLVLHEIQKRGKIILLLVGAVDAIVDGDKPDALVPEHDVSVKTHFQIVTPKAAHVLYDDAPDTSGLYLGNHGLEALALEGRATYSIVREVANVLKAILLSIPLQKFLLRGDLSRVFSPHRSVEIAALNILLVSSSVWNSCRYSYNLLPVLSG